MTTTNNLRQRVQRIEAQRPAVTYPPYLSVASAEDIPAALEGWPADRFVKVFIRVSPDDWDAVEP